MAVVEMDPAIARERRAKKRVCLVVQSYYLRDPRVRREAEALASAGYQVDVICIRDKGEKWRETVNGVHITRLPISRRRATILRYMLEYATFFVGVAAILTLRLFTGRYDLIHVNNMPDFLVFSTLLPRLFGTKIVIDVHDPMAEVFMSKYGMKSSSLIIRLLRWQEKISLRYCHHVLTVSDVMKERLQEPAGYTPISVVLNVPDESLFSRPARDLSERKSEDRFTLLYTGTISRRYGLAVAIEAAARLKNQIPGLKLRVVGEGDDLPSLREMVSRLRLEDVVEFHPAVPISRIPEFIQESDVGISPHVNDVFMDLCFSTKVAEFVNMGLPTVVSRTRTIERYFDEGMVRYCEAGNPGSFERAVLELYRDPELRAQMSANCAEFRKRWSWTVEKETYLGVVDGLVGIRSEAVVEPKGKILILVENLSVPFDRRVWMESLALTEAGYRVSVICPNRPSRAFYEVIDGISIYRYPAPPEGEGVVSYIREYLPSLWHAFWLSIKVRRREGFDVLQACNPPDILFLIGLFHRFFGRKKFVFDHHDLTPELFALRYDPQGKSLIYRLLLLLERWSIRTADIVISTNESYKAVAVKRGGKSPDKVFVVRNGPDLERFKPVPANPELKKGRDYLVCYVGVMGYQDGLDYLVRAIEHVVHRRGRRDITFALIGRGDALETVKRLAAEAGVADDIVFTGRISDANLAEYLSTADVCVGPDPCNDFNDKSTFIKIAEYMAMSKPIVCFDLTEQRYTAGDAAVYVSGNNTEEFGDKIIELIDDPERCIGMGQAGRKRVQDFLCWEHSKRILVDAYDSLLGVGRIKTDRAAG